MIKYRKINREKTVKNNMQIMTKNEVNFMAKKQIKKLTVSTYHSEEKILGIELPDGRFLSEKNTILNPRYIKEITQTRISSELKNVFYEMYNAQIEKDKLEKERDEIIKQIRKQQLILNQMPDKLQKAKGLLTYDEFVKIFQNTLPSRLKTEIDRFGYSYDSPMGICYSSDLSIYISRYADIQKYYHGSLTEQEYDGTYQLRHDCEKDREYKRLIQKYSKPLSVKMKISEELSLGDKDWLSYSGFYQIPIKKNMTKEYAAELANKFAAK